MDDQKTQLMVIGTVHQHHHGGYSLDHLWAILDAADPDVICVEIRPADFENGDFRSYPREMSEVGVKWAASRGRPCCPIDWWREEDIGKQVPDTLEDVTRHPWQPLRWKSTRDIEWRHMNSPEFCVLCKKYHGIEGSIFEAEPSFWKTRNMEMATLIDGVVRAYPAKKISVLTGNEHKYWFDEYFAGRLGVDVVQPTALTLPDGIVSQDSPETLLGVIGAYLEGRTGNMFPDHLDTDGLREDLEEIERALQGDSAMAYLKGLFHYVVREYEASVHYLTKAVEAPEMTIPFGSSGRIKPPGPIALMRLSQALDLLGRRDEAVEVNKKARDMLPNDHPWHALFQRRIEKPFTRPAF